jgi:hypothetical protein
MPTKTELNLALAEALAIRDDARASWLSILAGADVNPTSAMQRHADTAKAKLDKAEAEVALAVEAAS